MNEFERKSSKSRDTPPMGERDARVTKAIFSYPAVRAITLGLWLIITTGAVMAAVTGFRIDNSVSIWFETDDPALTEYRAYLDDFGSREWMLVALDRPNESPVSADVDRTELMSRLLALEHVHTIVSAEDFPPSSDLVQDVLRPNPDSTDESLLLLVTNDIDTEEAYREDLVTQIREAVIGLSSINAVHVAGIAVINGELNQASRHDMFLFFPLVTVFLCLMSVFLFRNARDTVVLLSISLGTVVVTQGLLIGLGNSLNMVTIMLPTIVIALSVADGIHLIHAFHGARQGAEDSYRAAGIAVKEIAWPCAGTTLTTISGFLAFSGSSVVPVFQLALFASFGIAFAWLLTMTGAPVLLAVLWKDRVRNQAPAISIGSHYLARWSRIVDRHPIWIVSAFVLLGASLFGLRSLQGDTDYSKFFRADTRVPQDYRALQQAGFPQNPLNLVFRVPAGETVTSTSYWAPLTELTNTVKQLSGVHSVISPFGSSGPPSSPDEQSMPDPFGFFTEDFRQAQIIVMTDYPSSRRLNELLSRIEPLAEEILPADVTVTPTGTSLLWAHMDDGVIRTQRESLLIVCVVCFGILLLLFRSLRLAGIGLALSLLPVGVVLGLMGFWGIPVNMATVLIAGIAVGLAVDDTIHFVHAFGNSRGQGADPRQACEDAIVTVGLRLVMTTLILVGAFASMGLSDFMPTLQFGLLSSLTIILALVADLALLPVLLAKIGQKQSGDPIPNSALHAPGS